MILSQLKLIVPLKLTTWTRVVREIPPVYLILLIVFAFVAGWALLRADIAVTWRSLLAVALLQLFFCTRLKYANNKKEFLNQYPYLLATSLLVDILLSTLPFLLLHILFWVAALFMALLYVLLIAKADSGIKLNKPSIPSPFFPKSAYLWHSQFRVFLPALWLFIVIITVIARVHENFNLAIVIYCGGIFISLVAIILQQEAPDFVSIYLNDKLFIRKTTKETLANTTVISLPVAALLLLLFPSQWQIVLLSFVCLQLIGITLLWTKYLFYPSMLLASLFSFIGIFIQAILAVSLYGLALIPLYYMGLFHLFAKRIKKHLSENERIDY